jgi:hypothetical protein
MANVPETQTRVAQLERKVELMEERLKMLEPDKKPQLDKEALEIVLDAAQISLGYTYDTGGMIKTAIAKLRGNEQ